MIRFLLLAVAIIAGAYAAASWMFGMLTDAGVAGAISAACVLVAEGIGYCQRRRDELARRVRAEVWERRDYEDWPANYRPDEFVIHAPGRYTPVDEPWRAVWPHEAGGFE